MSTMASPTSAHADAPERTGKGVRLRLGSWTLMAPWTLWLVALYALPLGFVVLVSFWTTQGSTLTPGFTLDNYTRIFDGSGDAALLLRTVTTAVMVVVIVALLCVPVAYFLVFRMRSASRAATALILIALPFLVGPLVRAIAWKGMLGAQGVINNLLDQLGIIGDPLQWLLFSRFAVIVALVYNTYPFMLFALVLSLETVDQRLLAAARDLGSGAFAAFRTVVLPLAAPGLLVGSVLAFVPAVSASVEPEILGGPKGRAFTNAISEQFLTANNWPAGCAMTVCFAIAATLLCGLIALALVGTFRGAFGFGGRR